MEEEQKKVSGAAALPKVGWKGMLALAFGILFFAGVFATVQGAEWLKAFDYSTLIGKFGTMKDPAKATFVGMGGVSARGGFIFALSLIPSVMLAIGVVDVLDHYGALSAAQKLMTPLFKPLMDVPGLVGLPMPARLSPKNYMMTALLIKENRRSLQRGSIPERERSVITLLSQARFSDLFSALLFFLLSSLWS